MVWIFFYCFLFFIKLNNILANSCIEIDIYNSLYEIKNFNYTYEILDQTDQIYKNSDLDITFYVKDEIFFQNDKNYINDLISYTNNYADITLILVNIPTLETVRGISYVNSICSQYSIIVANIYDLSEKLIPYIIAHELGHILGAHHDDSYTNIMNSNINHGKIYFFSENSKNEMRLTEPCLLNEPKKYIYMSQEKLLDSFSQSNLSLNFFILCVYLVITIVIILF